MRLKKTRSGVLVTSHKKRFYKFWRAIDDEAADDTPKGNTQVPT